MSGDLAPAFAPARLALDGELTIYRAAELKQQMLSALDEAAEAACFDLSGVTEIDTAGVQLLLLSRREASSRALDLSLVAPSPAVASAFRLLALDAHLAAG